MKELAEKLTVSSLLIASLGMLTLLIGGLKHIGMLIYMYFKGLPLVVEPVYSLIFWSCAIITSAIIVFLIALLLWNKVDTTTEPKKDWRAVK